MRNIGMEQRSLSERFRDANGTPGEVFVVAHRGLFLESDRVVAPENSVTAIRAARDAGIDMVEIDVHRTVDGTMVVIHDPTLDRTTSATGPVETLRRRRLQRQRQRCLTRTEAEAMAALSMGRTRHAWRS